MGKYLDIARKFEARRAEGVSTRQSAAPLQPAPDYRQAAEAIADNCWTLDPAWLLDHPEFYQRIRTLDDRLTEMEQRAARESEYQAVLMQLVRIVQSARAAYEQKTRQDSARVVQ